MKYKVGDIIDILFDGRLSKTVIIFKIKEKYINYYIYKCRCLTETLDKINSYETLINNGQDSYKISRKYKIKSIISE